MIKISKLKPDDFTIWQNLGFRLESGTFDYIKIPKGWRKTDFNTVLDKKGRVRVRITKKTIKLVRRFNIRKYKQEFNDKIVEGVSIRDQGRVFFKIEADIVERATEIAKQWLKREYPNWENPLNYWE